MPPHGGTRSILTHKYEEEFPFWTYLITVGSLTILCHKKDGGFCHSYMGFPSEEPLNDNNGNFYLNNLHDTF